MSEESFIPLSEAARLLTRELGFPVSMDTLKGACQRNRRRNGQAGLPCKKFGHLWCVRLSVARAYIQRNTAWREAYKARRKG